MNNRWIDSKSENKSQTVIEGKCVDVSTVTKQHSDVSVFELNHTMASASVSQSSSSLSATFTACPAVAFHIIAYISYMNF